MKKACFPNIFPLLAALAVTSLLTGCPVEGTRSADKRPAAEIPFTVPKDVRVSWSANRETAVNMTGGGYQVHYSSTNNFSVPSATYQDVPYVSGSAAPTSVVLLKMKPGTHYIRVVPYSARKASGTASSQITVVVR